jgi:hypothetical protein
MNILPSAAPPNYSAQRVNAASSTLTGGLRVQAMAGGADVSSINPLPVTLSGAVTTVNINPLDVAVVTTGGTAVTAIGATGRLTGGWIHNPASATTNLGINEIGTASGTTSNGNTTFIAPGQTYQLAPSANAVSVIASDSGHVFSGYGFTP